MKKLLLLLILAGAVFGGKLYIENRYKKSLDQVINLARSQADISYKDLKIGFDGSVNIYDVSINSNDATGLFKIKKASAITSDRLALITGNAFKDGKTPEWLKVSVDQISMDSTLIDPDPDEACTTLDTAFPYSEIGIEQILSNAYIEFDFNDKDDVEAVINYEDQTSSLELVLNFSMVEAEKAIITGTQPINNLRFSSFLDPSYASEFNEYCAKKLNLTTEQYLTEVIGSPKYSYDSFGYNFGDQVSEALVSYVKGGHNFSVNTNFSDELKKLSSITTLTPQQVVRALNLQVKLDDKPILVKSNTVNTFEKEEPKEDEPLVIRSRRLKYQSDSVSNIPNLIDKKVKIWRNNKARIDGRIENYANGIAFVEIRRGGGKAVYEIKVQDIQKIEVLR